MCVTDHHDMTLTIKVTLNLNTAKQLRGKSFQITVGKEEIGAGCRMVAWCLPPFSIVFRLYSGGQYTYTCFLEFLFTYTIFFPSYWLLSHIIIIETMGNGVRGKIPVAMTRQSSERILADLAIDGATSCFQKSYTLPT